MSPPGAALYTLPEVVQRLKPQFDDVVERQSLLIEEVCPRDYSVSKLTLHPSYISKSHFPRTLLREMGVHSIGSKADEVLPDKWTRKGKPKSTPSTSLFIAGKRHQLAEFSNKLYQINMDTPGASDLLKVWSVESIPESTKVKKSDIDSEGYFEAGLQLMPEGSSEFIKHSFIEYAGSLGFSVEKEWAIGVSSLWFIPLIGEPDRVGQLAQHSFVRVVRPLPMLRSFRPIIRSMPISAEANLPSSEPYSSDVRVAILDGGLPQKHALTPWVNNYIISDSSAQDCADGPAHGVAVTSAFLFGPLSPDVEAQRPFSYVDHHRVLDSGASHENRLELYRTLTHIEDILMSRQYEFINISLGPDLPVDDDEVHPWTSLLDTYLAEGDTFLTIAAGNNGEMDEQEGLCRIQVPSDCVNAVAVGAADKTISDWQRASYSAKGPGRAPGRVKPDLLAFGGSINEYFHVTSDDGLARLTPTCGTSFASPYLLRKAVGVRAILGHSVSPLAIKALLVHSAEQGGHDPHHVGWGKAPESINQIIESPDGVARILYQGELFPGKYLKVPLPIPKEGIKGKVKIKATCCFSTPVDPQDTSMYTKAGVEITWRPKPKPIKSESFFKQKKVATEAELRSDAGKWESVLHAEKTKFGSSLQDPAFEIHYMARDGGDSISGAKAPTINYAFIVSLEAPKHSEIFNDILRAYSNVLTEIQPRISTPIPVQL
ncbi:S8 family peptidase [Endozoicomonas sp. 4G]|uniref:S8 family peptidase n=1 Tax=Endozoicomonas sp. 4G TaxID=2872754 RepID=UPI002078DF0D|nr:S8 family peptidase [Endozoicomonas sp. 4G]